MRLSFFVRFPYATHGGPIIRIWFLRSCLAGGGVLYDVKALSTDDRFSAFLAVVYTICCVCRRHLCIVAMNGVEELRQRKRQLSAEISDADMSRRTTTSTPSQGSHTSHCNAMCTCICMLVFFICGMTGGRPSWLWETMGELV